jgi:hypothetical protein
MKGLWTDLTAAAVFMAVGCQAKEPPTQVVYRFDDHRYLELKGWDCEGELWYVDAKKGIHSQIASQFYRIFTKNLCILQNAILPYPGGECNGFFSIERLWANVGKRWCINVTGRK